MALNLLLQQQSCSPLARRWATTSVVTRRSVVSSRCWPVQLERKETVRGGGGELSVRCSHSLRAEHGFDSTRRRLGSARGKNGGRRLIHALRIDASEVVEEDEKDLNGTKSAEAILPSPLASPSLSSSASPLQLPQPPPPPLQQQQLQPQRLRRVARGGGGGIQWILGPLALLITGAFPALWLPSHTLFSGSITAGLLALAGLDSTFHMGATAFLLMADASARGKAPAESSNQQQQQRSSIPLGYKVWSFMVNLTGLLVPGAVVAMAMEGKLSPGLEWLPAAALLGPYTLMLLVQWVAEAMVSHWHSPVWPVLPIVYQAYRLLQLTRGLELGPSAAIAAPAWLVQGLLKGLVAWWVFVLGMQIMWLVTLVGSLQQQEQWTSGH
ncbi:hypothetical protein MARPO_0010s0201 [Marchantia polymorpha]|nr:hypothetical protein MARPO_0010s0201 [Marchantia polymorpha]|eukprot:PTQ46834.1 hypothetical protein MARPO_0010s0201 [Marchantia polymorpha]